MGTKNNPGDFDCYSKAEPDEPMFVLLARDGIAPDIVLAWAELALSCGVDYAKVKEARACAYAMTVWRVKNRR